MQATLPPTVQAKYLCPAGIRRTPDRAATVLWIQSPRSGRKLELVLSPQTEKLLAPRTVSRVTHANANGRGTVELTREELAAFRAAVEAARGPQLPVADCQLPAMVPEPSTPQGEQHDVARDSDRPQDGQHGPRAVEMGAERDTQRGNDPGAAQVVRRDASVVCLDQQRPDSPRRVAGIEVEPLPEPTLEPADDVPPEMNDDGMIVCTVGTRPAKGSSYSVYLWIQPTAGSPRMELYLGHEAWMLPNYTAQRIIDAKNKRQKTVAFTPAELAAYRRAMAAPPPPPITMYDPAACAPEGGEYRGVGCGGGGRLQRRNGG